MKKSILIAAFAMLCATAQAQNAPKDTVTTVMYHQSVQCSGTTKAGKRCKRMTKDLSGLCFMHNPKRKGERE